MYIFIWNNIKCLSINECLQSNNLLKVEMEQGNSQLSSSQQSELNIKAPDITLGAYNDYLEEHLRKLSEHQSQKSMLNIKSPKIFTVSQTLRDPFILSHIKPDYGSLGQFMSNISSFNNRDLLSQKKRKNDQATPTDQDTEQRKLKSTYKDKNQKDLINIYLQKQTTQLQKGMASKMMIENMFKEQFGCTLNKFQSQNNVNFGNNNSNNKKGYTFNLNNIQEIFKNTTNSLNNRQQSMLMGSQKNTNVTKINKSSSTNIKNRLNFPENESEDIQSRSLIYEDPRKNKKMLKKAPNLPSDIRISDDNRQTILSEQIKNSHYRPNANIAQNNKQDNNSFLINVRPLLKSIKDKYITLKRYQILDQCPEFKVLSEQYERQLQQLKQKKQFEAANKKKLLNKRSYEQRTQETQQFSRPKKIITFKIFMNLLETEINNQLDGYEQQQKVIEIENVKLTPQIIIYIVYHFSQQFNNLASISLRNIEISQEALCFFMQSVQALGAQSLKFLTLQQINISTSAPSIKTKNLQKNNQPLCAIIRTILEKNDCKLQKLIIKSMNITSKQFCVICLGIAVCDQLKIVDFGKNHIDEGILRALEMIMKNCIQLEKIILADNYLQGFHLRRLVESAKTKIVL